MQMATFKAATTTGTSVYADVAYAPYGESYAPSGASDLSFTGQNQDTASGLYDFMYREYHPTQGRWTSPDPAGMAVVDPMNPQTWNRYAYVGGNPLALVDPSGLRDCEPSDDACVVAPAPDPVDIITIDLGGCSIFSVYCAADFGGGGGGGANHNGGGGGGRTVNPAPAANNQQCPSVPQSPGWLPNVDANIKATPSWGAWYDWYQHIQHGGPWDFKYMGRYADDFGRLPQESQGSPFEDFGNFNFGATGAKAHVPEFIAVRGAGSAGVIAKEGYTASGLWDATKAFIVGGVDDPADTTQIRNGYAYYRAGCHQ